MKKFLNEKTLFFDEKTLIFVIVITALLIRLLYLPVPFIINEADAQEYLKMANVALAGNWQSFLDDFSHRTPLYPLFVASSKIIFGQFWHGGLAWLQHFLAVIMSVLIFLIGKKVFNKETGFLAGILTATNTYQVYWEHNLMTDFFFTFLTVLVFYFFLKALVEKRKADCLIFGILFGLNLLTRPLFQAFFVVFPILLYLFNFSSQSFAFRLKATLKKFGYIMLPALLIISPWLLQHWYRHHYFGLTPSLGPNLMVRAQNYMDLESPLRAEEKRIYLQTMIELVKCDEVMIKNGTCPQVGVAGWQNLQKKLGYSQTEANQVLSEIGFEAIRKNPGRYLKETGKEIKIFLTKHSRVNFFGDLDLDPQFREAYLLRLKAKDRLTTWHQEITWWLTFDPAWIATLAFWGMLLALGKKNLKALPFALVALYIIFLTCAIEEGESTRYRIPADPFMFLFAAYILVSIPKGIRYLMNYYGLTSVVSKSSRLWRVRL